MTENHGVGGSIPSLGTISLLLAMLVPAAAVPAQVARFERFSYRGHTQEQAVAGPGAYRNPILEGYYPDPSVTRVGRDYYLVNSSFAHFPGLPVFHSTDLVNWRQIGNAIDRPGQLDFTGRGTSEAVFAPDISFHAGRFYIVNTCVQCGGNFFLTAANPAGPWSNPTWLPFEGIDPSIYWEGDRAYIVNNRAPDEPPRYDGHRAIWLQEFDWRAGRMVGPATQIVNGGTDLSARPSWIEGPHLLRKDGFYYLVAAEGGTGDRHSEVVFRSAALRGPYQPFAGNPILTQRDLAPDRPHPVTSAGHAELIQTQTGEWWATFLATRPYAGDKYLIGRETFLLPVEWRGGWPIILDRNRPIPFVVRKPALPASPPAVPPTSGDFAYVDEFEGARLAPQWIGIRIPATPFYRLTGGMLELESRAPLGDRAGVPAFLGRRLQHHDAVISTTVRFVPARDGARAGLAAVQSDRSNLFFGVTRLGGRPVVALYTRDKAEGETLVASAPIDPATPVTLTLRIAAGMLAFDYAARGAVHTLKRDLAADLLTTERAGGFVGTVVGPFAYTPG